MKSAMEYLQEYVHQQGGHIVTQDGKQVAIGADGQKMTFNIEEYRKFIADKTTEAISTEEDNKRKQSELDMGASQVTDEQRLAYAQQQDELNAKLAASASELGTRQAGRESDYLVKMMTAKSGGDYVRASYDLSYGQMYDEQSTALKNERDAVLAQMKAHGGYTQEDMNRVEADYAAKQQGIDNTKKMTDAMADMMQQNNVGQKSGLTDAWEQIQASVFGREQDPVVDAVTAMNQEMAAYQGNMYGLLSDKLPVIAQSLAGALNGVSTRLAPPQTQTPQFDLAGMQANGTSVTNKIKNVNTLMTAMYNNPGEARLVEARSAMETPVMQDVAVMRKKDTTLHIASGNG